MKCDNCGCEQWTFIASIGAIETWRCPVCANEVTVHISGHISFEDLPFKKEDVFRLLAEWSAKPTVKDVESLRALFPEVKDLTLAVLMRAAREKSAIDLGVFTDDELEPICAES